MKKIIYTSVCLSLLISFELWSQEMPEYNNSAIAWNSKINKSVQLQQEEGLRNTKLGAGNYIPMGGFFAKNKVVLVFQGEKSIARITSEDTLRIFAKIDKDVNPNGLFKVYRATIKNGNREVLAMTASIKGAQRSDGDFPCTYTKVSPGTFLVKIIGPKSGDELFFYIGTHETAMAKLTLGID
jgi:hypothetical protein